MEPFSSYVTLLLCIWKHLLNHPLCCLTVKNDQALGHQGLHITVPHNTLQNVTIFFTHNHTVPWIALATRHQMLGNGCRQVSQSTAQCVWQNAVIQMLMLLFDTICCWHQSIDNWTLIASNLSVTQTGHSVTTTVWSATIFRAMIQVLICMLSMYLNYRA